MLCYYCCTVASLLCYYCCTVASFLLLHACVVAAAVLFEYYCCSTLVSLSIHICVVSYCTRPHRRACCFSSLSPLMCSDLTRACFRRCHCAFPSLQCDQIVAAHHRRRCVAVWLRFPTPLSPPVSISLTILVRVRPVVYSYTAETSGIKLTLVFISASLVVNRRVELIQCRQ